MKELKWLDEYTGQTADELLELEDEYRADSLVLAFEAGVQKKAADIGMGLLSDEERVILVIEALEREVNKGGYDQFLRNSSREYASIVVNALFMIGCSKAAAITRDAINALGIQGPLTIEAIDRVMEVENEERDEKLDACDHRFADIAGDLARLLLQYIRNNSSEINLPATPHPVTAEPVKENKQWWKKWK